MTGAVATYNKLAESLLKETISGFLFWSIFCGFGPMVWFYPLNELYFTGYELFLVVFLSPALALSSWFANLIQDYWMVILLKLLVVSGIASFQMPTTFFRLLFLSLGMMASLILLMISLWNISLYQRLVSYYGLILGMFALLVGRIWYVSLIPPWADSMSNTIVVAVGSAAVLDSIFSDIHTHRALFTAENVSDEPSHWIWIGVGFGSLLYITQALFTEVSVICRWVVAGYPHPGPLPNPWGAAVLLFLACGILLSLTEGSKFFSWQWWTTGAIGLLAVYYLPTYMGFLGGLCLGVYIMTLWPLMINNMQVYQPQYILTLGMAVYLLEILFSVWTVAYNFVPGGIYTRENTGFLIYVIVVSFGLATCLGKKFKENSKKEVPKEVEHKMKKYFSAE